MEIPPRHFEQVRKKWTIEKSPLLMFEQALKVLIYKAYYASNKNLTLASGSYFIASSTATAVAAVAPTIGLLPSKEKLIFESFLGSKNPQALILRALR